MSAVRILCRTKRGVAKLLTIRNPATKFAPADVGEAAQHVLVFTNTANGQWESIPMASLIAWGDEAIERLLALQPVSAAAPDSPWRTVESGRYPGEDHLVSAGDKIIMGHGDRASVAYLKAAGEFCRGLFPSENSK